MGYSIHDIRDANRRAGFHFFSPDTMRFFRSSVEPYVYEGIGGVYFVTTEQFVPPTGNPSPRRATVRRFDPLTADISTVGPFNEMTVYMAAKAATRLAAGESADQAFDEASSV